ncbi:MAG TPA: hypothetical protein VKB86_07840 [Pyrinomonadaceae bacterium]|nr:hypothetical protein [Pyrinomonadaceae bacterium]
MRIKVSQVEFRISFFPVLLTAILLLFSPSTNAQETASNQNANSASANKTTTNEKSAKSTNISAAAAPVFTDYKGIRIGMSADEVRNKLDHLKDKGKDQDFFVFSDAESAQVYYDAKGKVTAVSVIYMGDDMNALKPQAVLGEEIQAKPDGSMYELKRYPTAGYWVAYSRTAGKSPIITVTMEKMEKVED